MAVSSVRRDRMAIRPSGWLAIAGAAGIAAGALVAGCGSSSNGGSAGSVIPQRGAPAAEIGAATLLAGIGRQGHGGQERQDPHRLHRIGRRARSSTSPATASPTSPDKKFQLTLNLPAAAGISGTIEERVIGKDFYLKLPAAEASVTGGKPWIKFNASELGASSSTGLNFTGQDPTQLLATLRGVSDSVTKVGTDRGPRRRDHALPGAGRSRQGRAGQRRRRLQPRSSSPRPSARRTIPEDVYLDSEGLPRRFAVTVNPVLPSTQRGSSRRLTVDRRSP